MEKLFIKITFSKFNFTKCFLAQFPLITFSCSIDPISLFNMGKYKIAQLRLL